MIFQLDLKRNPEVADLIADMDMGSKVSFITSLKSKTPDLAEFTLERAKEGPEDEEKDDNADEESSEETATDSSGSTNTPGGSTDQDRLAASLSAQT